MTFTERATVSQGAFGFHMSPASVRNPSQPGATTFTRGPANIQISVAAAVELTSPTRGRVMAAMVEINERTLRCGLRATSSIGDILLVLDETALAASCVRKVTVDAQFWRRPL